MHLCDINVLINKYNFTFIISWIPLVGNSPAYDVKVKLLVYYISRFIVTVVSISIL